MLFQYHEIATLPPLAWCARVDRGCEGVAVFHGARVETRPGGFFEGAWNDSFASFDFASATILCGTGGALERGRVRFFAGTDPLGPLFTIAKAGSVYVSNSPAFVITTAGEEPDDIYPFYPYDLLRIFRLGLRELDGHLRLRSTIPLGVHFTTVIAIDERGSVSFDTHRLCESPADYQAYKELLFEGTKKLLENAADATRKQRYLSVACLSTGYDSTATAVLAVSAGCTEAFTLVDPRREDPEADNGAANAEYLGLTCKTYGRWDYLELDTGVEAEFGYSPVSCHVTFAVAEDRLAGRIMVGGEFGDSIWDPKRIGVFENLSRPWNRYPIFAAIEFRLRVGFQNFAPSSIGSRHNEAMHKITTSAEMRPWSVGGDYDRPMPRRIIEEEGLPRGRFATQKIASGHSHLTDPSRFSKRALSDYRHFAEQRHAEIPRHIYTYWRARARWRHYLWDTVGSKRRRFVRSSPLQRRFPFIVNTTPIRIPWDFMFTFQWTVAAMRERYTLPVQWRRAV